MRAVKRIAVAGIGILMVVFMILSSSNLIQGETKREIKKISVIGLDRNAAQVDDFKRGIEEAANIKRVDINYQEIGETEADVDVYVERECENGAQALIVFSDKEEQILSYLKENNKKIPLIMVSPESETDDPAAHVWFDTQEMAELLVEHIEEKRKQDGDVPVVFLTDKSKRSERILKLLRAAFQEKGIEIKKKKLTSVISEGGIYIGATPEITEKAVSYLKNENTSIYGIGYSKEVLRYVRENRIEGVVAYSSYTLGILAVKSAAASIENKSVETKQQISCRWINKENITAQYEFLFPIY